MSSLSLNSLKDFQKKIKVLPAVPSNGGLAVRRAPVSVRPRLLDTSAQPREDPATSDQNLSQHAANPQATTSQPGRLKQVQQTQLQQQGLSMGRTRDCQSQATVATERTKLQPALEAKNRQVSAAKTLEDAVLMHDPHVKLNA